MLKLINRSILIIGFILLLCFFGCKGGGGGASGDSTSNNTGTTTTPIGNITLSNILVDVNGSLQLDGSGFLNANSAEIVDSQNQRIALELQANRTDARLTARALSPFALILNDTYSLIISSAQGATTFPITISLPSNSITTAHLQNDSITISKISVTSGIASSTTFLRGDGTWSTPPTPTLGRTSCPAGYTLIGTAGDQSAYCISSDVEHDYSGSTTGSYYTALISCNSKTPKARLCTPSEWTSACLAYSALPAPSMQFSHITLPTYTIGSLMGGTSGVYNNTACATAGSTITTNNYWRCCL